MVRISPELVGSLFTGLTGLLAALAAFTATRSKRVAEDRRAFKRQARGLQQRLIAALDHIFDLEQLLAQRGLRVPPRPRILEVDDEEENEPPPGRRAAASSDAP